MDFNIFSLEISKAIGWAVVHSVWQIILISIVVKSVLLMFKKSSPIIKYRIVFTALLTTFVAFVSTFAWYYTRTLVPEEAVNYKFIVFENTSEIYQSSFIDTLSSFIDSNTHIIVLIWTVGILLYLLKIIFGFVYVEHIKKYNTIQIQDSFIEKFNRLRDKIGVNKLVRFLESGSVNVPMVVGHFKPVLLIPAGMLSGLSYSHIEAIVAHELAHVYRNDFIVNLFVAIIESLFFFHPLMWWMTTILEDEREKCCDDIAISVTGDKLLYAKALASVVEYSNVKPYLALSFSGNKEKLYLRISRLLKETNMKTSIREKIILPVALILICTTLAFTTNDKANNEKYIDEEPSIAETDQHTIVTSTSTSTSSSSTKSDKEKKKKKKITAKSDIKKSSSKIKSGDNVKVKMKDGKIEELVINGKVIDEKDYDKYAGDINNNSVTLTSGDGKYVQTKSVVVTHTDSDNEQVFRNISDGDNVSVTMSTGNVKELIVNGKVIEEKDHDAYIVNDDGEHIYLSDDDGKTVVKSKKIVIQNKNGKSNITIHKKVDGDKLYVKMTDGEVVKIKVNGKVIPEKDYHKYEHHITDVDKVSDKDIKRARKDIKRAKKDIERAEKEIEKAKEQMEVDKEKIEAELERVEEELEKSRVKVEHEVGYEKDNLEIVEEVEIEKEELDEIEEARRELERVKNSKKSVEYHKDKAVNVDKVMRTVETAVERVDVEHIADVIEFAVENIDMERVVDNIELSIDAVDSFINEKVLNNNDDNTTIYVKSKKKVKKQKELKSKKKLKPQKELKKQKEEKKLK
jgi:beta-lactamase regulating signal transducer with metallopeptidase domain